MPLLPPNQQCQSTEGNAQFKQIKITAAMTTDDDDDHDDYDNINVSINAGVVVMAPAIPRVQQGHLINTASALGSRQPNRLGL